MIYKMRFTGQAVCKKTKKLKKWNKGDEVEGVFDDLLPDTYITLNTSIKAKKKPKTTKRKGTRKK